MSKQRERSTTTTNKALSYNETYL